MQNRLSLTALAILLALTSGCGQSAPPPAQGAVPAAAANQPAKPPAPEAAKAAPAGDKEGHAQTLVTVNGTPITIETFGIYYNDRMQRSPGAQDSPEMQSQAINELINMMLLAQEARNQGIEKLPNVQTSLDLQRDQLLSKLALQQQAQQRLPTDAELKVAYEEKYVNQPSEEYKARHILVESEEEAKKVAAELQAGGNFAELAGKYSVDTTSKVGGDLGWFNLSQMVEPFATALSKLAVGGKTDTPVKSQFGWHLIQLDDKRKRTIPSFDSVKPQLMAAQQGRLLGDYVSSLREKAKIELSPLLTEQPEPAAGDKPADKAANQPADKPAAK